MSEEPVTDSTDRASALKRLIPRAVATAHAPVPHGSDGLPRHLTREQRDAMSPHEILELMRRGNERFRRGERLDRDFLREQEASVGAQNPAAILLTCIDSRAPAEIIMDLGIGEVFNARLAGNIADASVIGSMEFACKIAGAKVILVMGHTGCSAVMGAIDGVRLGHFTGVLERIEPAVLATACRGDATSANPNYVNDVARTNVRMTMARIRAESSVLDALVREGKLAIAGAMYDLASAKVEFLD